MNCLIFAEAPQDYDSLRTFLLKKKYNVFFCRRKEDVLLEVREKNIKLIIMELNEEDIQDFSLLRLVKEYDHLIEVIIIGEPASSEKIGESIRLGASEYITKPLRIKPVESVLKRIKENKLLRHETFLLEKKLKEKYFFHGMVGKNPNMLDIFTLIERVAKYDTTVLISGDTGTGKEMVAQAIHELSPRSMKKLVVCDCSALPETLFESELFGHVRGAFTGADRTKKGLIEEAQGGTLFLDEIGNLSLPLQSKLLRVLEDRQFRRLGSTENIYLDIRLVSATSRDLKIGIRNKTFREDLYHRLNTVEIHLPALKDRKEDIPLMFNTFLEKYSKKFSKNIKGISRRVQKILLSHDWPGNVRELENAVEHAVALCSKDFIDLDDLPKYLVEAPAEEKKSIASAMESFITLEELEKQHIKKVMEATQGNIQKTAAILGISRYTLYRKLKEINLSF